jgi:cytochrome c-type biogenesis protein CcmH
VTATATHTPLQRTWLPWLPLFAVLALALTVGALGSRGPVTDEERVLALSRLVQCPQCDGETASESNAPAARILRMEIDAQVRAGRTDEQILAGIETQYPGRVLTPPSSGLAGLVWVLPVTALVLALVGLAVAFRRWGRPSDERASAEDRALVERALGERTG